MKGKENEISMDGPPIRDRMTMLHLFCHHPPECTKNCAGS